VFEANETPLNKEFKPRCICGSPAKRFYTAPKIRELTKAEADEVVGKAWESYFTISSWSWSLRVSFSERTWSARIHRHAVPIWRCLWERRSAPWRWSFYQVRFGPLANCENAHRGKDLLGRRTPNPKRHILEMR